MELSPEDISRIWNYLDLLIKPSLKEIGGVLGDQVKVWRYKNQLRLIEVVKEIHAEMGVKSPRPIQVKTLGNLLDYSSYEEDEIIKEKWANLLANATNPSNEYKEHFVLVNILKDLSSYEVMVLDYMYKEDSDSSYPSPREHDLRILGEMARRNGDFESYESRENQEKEEIIIASLKRHGLIESIRGDIKKRDNSRYGGKDEHYQERSRKMKMTALGWRLSVECSSNV